MFHFLFYWCMMPVHLISGVGESWRWAEDEHSLLALKHHSLPAGLNSNSRPFTPCGTCCWSVAFRPPRLQLLILWASMLCILFLFLSSNNCSRSHSRCLDQREFWHAFNCWPGQPGCNIYSGQFLVRIQFSYCSVQCSGRSDGVVWTLIVGYHMQSQICCF